MQRDLSSVHRKILKEAWQITWRNKWLWFLGLFAAFWGNGETYQYFLSAVQNMGNAGEIGKSFWQQVSAIPVSSLPLSPISIVIFTLIIAVIGLIVWLGTASRGGLFTAINGLKEGKVIKIREALSAGTEKFWSILFLSLIGKIVGAGLLFALIIFVGKIAFGFWALSIPLYLLGFVVCFGLAIIVSFVTIFAMAFVMLKKEKFLNGISKAVMLFLKNWLLAIELALIIFAIGIVLGLLVAFCCMVLAVPFILLWVIFAALKFNLAFWLIAIPLLIVVFAFLLFLGAAFSVFQITAWVLLFKRLTEGGAISKLIRIFHKK